MFGSKINGFQQVKDITFSLKYWFPTTLSQKCDISIDKIMQRDTMLYIVWLVYFQIWCLNQDLGLQGG